MNIDLPVLPEIKDECQLVNCVGKRYRHLRKWAKRTETNCFRIYDRDIKEHPFSIDYYAGQFCVQTYLIDESRFTQVEETVVQMLIKLFGPLRSPLIWKHRARREKLEQYDKMGESEDFFTVYEHGVKFWVNLKDYLDTGLFLDHRETRQIVAKACQGKRLLNLFAYTSTFSVHAAIQGAAFTKSVDLSNTYLHWSENNFTLNRLSKEQNQLERGDCLKWMTQTEEKFDVIVIDPPTISRSKKMEQFFDIQIDYVLLIKQALRLLLPHGLIFFSTNSRKFAFDTQLFPQCTIIDISHKTIPLDFHQQKIHQCWKIEKIDFFQKSAL